MKKLILLLFVGSWVQFASAQELTDVGRWTVGGGFNASISKNNYENTIFVNRPSTAVNVLVSPYFGKRIAKRFFLAGQLETAYNTFALEANDFFPVDEKETQLSVSIGLFARCFFNVERRFNFFVQPAVTFTVPFQKDNIGDDLERQGEEVLTSVGLGAIYRLNDNWRLFSTFNAVGFTTNTQRNSTGDIFNRQSILVFGDRLTDIVIGAEYLLR
ncbi:MAG: hypothetical protein AAGJ82_06255 [Bacteroidota bacterium]